MNLKETGYEGVSCIELVQGRIQCKHDNKRQCFLVVVILCRLIRAEDGDSMSLKHWYLPMSLHGMMSQKSNIVTYTALGT
jgi:hypothetical protein